MVENRFARITFVLAITAIIGRVYTWFYSFFDQSLNRMIIHSRFMLPKTAFFRLYVVSIVGATILSAVWYVLNEGLSLSQELDWDYKRAERAYYHFCMCIPLGFILMLLSPIIMEFTYWNGSYTILLVFILIVLASGVYVFPKISSAYSDFTRKYFIIDFLRFVLLVFFCIFIGFAIKDGTYNKFRKNEVNAKFECLNDQRPCLTIESSFL